MTFEDEIVEGEHVKSLLKSIGIEPSDCAEIHVDPSRLTVTMFAKDENGRKFVWKSGPQKGAIAQYKSTFKIRWADEDEDE